MNTKLVGAALTSSIMLSGCNLEPSSHLTLENPEPISRGVERRIDKTFNHLRHYWQERTLGAFAVRLRLLKSGAQTDCPAIIGPATELAWNDPSVTEYCSTNHTVDISQAAVEVLEDVSRVAHIPLQVDFNIVIGHELGHTEQNIQTGLLFVRKKTTTDTISRELQADCYSGVANRGTSTATLKNATAFYKALTRINAGFYPGESVVDHGTVTQRIQNFMHGANTGSC